MTDKLSVADDWIEWNGGECPVNPGIVVETMWRCETPDCYDDEALPADRFVWKHYGSSYDIIAYRLARERGL